MDTSSLLALSSLLKRAECTADGCEEMPTSTWEKTGIPVLISVVLFFVVFAVLFVIIRQKRQRTRRAEEAAQGKIDLEDVEDRAAFTAGRRK